MTSLGDLSDAKRALLEERLLKRRAAAVEQTIPRRGPDDPLVLSYAQELLWTTQQISPHSIAYNVPRPMRLEGRLDMDALSWALDEIVSRHEVLRTNVVLRDGAPELVVQEPSRVPIAVIDLRDRPERDRRAEAQDTLERESRRPFDLARDTMLRATAIREADDSHLLLLASHHIASDGWSTTVLFRELAELYGIRLNKLGSALPELPIQYSDFALWQRRWLDGPRGQAQLGYWRERLADAPAQLQLPLDHPRPPTMSFDGARLSRMSTADLHERLQALGREERATLFMTLLAAFMALLSRYTGETDIVVGSPIANRNRRELEGLIGYFSNTLVLRGDLSGDPSFRELLQRVRDVALGAFANPDLPFEKLIEELRPERNLAHTPIYQVLFVLQTMPSIPPQLPGLETSRPKHDPGWAKFDLTLSLSERVEGINASWEYATDLFEPDTIARMSVHYERLLRAVVEDPDRRMSEIALLDDDERRLVLETPNETAAPWPSDRCLHDLFDETAAQTPSAPALSTSEGRTTSYAELAAAANRLARVLRARGVGAGDLVGICVERSPQLAVAVLAVLKAGGAYVPLDPTYPDEQLSVMLDDGRPAMVLCTERSYPSVPESSMPAVKLEDLEAECAAQPASPPEPVATPEDLAYVMYTSGSTGVPKGVMVEHRGVVNFVTAAARRYGLRPSDRVLQFASFSFDISVEEMFASWAAGATLVLRSDTAPLAGPRFHNWLRGEGITVLDLPTAFWHAWVEDLERLGTPPPRTIRTVIVGGERARTDVYRRWLRLAGPDVRVFNTYGPTETSVVATVHEMRPEDAEDPGGIVIGKPLENLRAYVLDEHLQPVPRGVRGELCIAGVGVGRGYLNRPELTAERFVPDVFSEPGGRLFRTGDVARQRRDGNLEFIGRRDRQVKVRGFRVEPDGIEAVLRALPGVSDAAVVTRDDIHGDTRLEAYIVPSRDDTTSGGVREGASTELAHYMVPSVFMLVDELPRTSSGKLDRSALRAPTSDARGGLREGPRTGTEQRLAAIWSDVLGLEGIARDDNFFDLGGHSLLAIRVFARIDTELGRRLPLATLFEAPTVRALAAAVDREEHDAEWSPVVTIQEGNGGPPLIVAPDIYGDTLMGYRELARRLGPEQRVLALRARGLDRINKPHTRIEDMAAAYVEDIRRVQHEGPYLLVGHCFGGNVALDVAGRLRADGQEVGLLALIDAAPYGHRASKRPMVNVGLHLTALRRRAITREYVRARLKAARVRFLRQVWWHGGHWLYRRTGILIPFLRADVAEANLRAAGEYVAPSYAGEVMLFLVGALDDVRNNQRATAWRSVASGGVDIHEIVGDEVNHLSILHEPHVRVIAAPLRERIAALAGRRSAAG